MGGQTVNGDYVMVVEPRKGRTQRVLTYDPGSSDPRVESYAWTASDLVKVGEGFGSSPGCSYTPPVPRLKLPLADGRRWSVSTRCGSDSVSFAFNVVSHSVEDLAGYGRLTLWRLVTVGEVRFAGVSTADRVTFKDDVQFSPELLVPVKAVLTSQTFKGSSRTDGRKAIRTLLAPQT